MSWHRGRHAWHQACVWVEMKPCAPAPTTTKAAGRHRAAASPLLLFAKPLILHYPIKSTGFSLNRLLYLRRSRKFAREIPSVSEWNITGCEPKGVWPESHSMEVHWCNITGLDDKDRPGASVKDTQDSWGICHCCIITKIYHLHVHVFKPCSFKNSSGFNSNYFIIYFFWSTSPTGPVEKLLNLNLF